MRTIGTYSSGQAERIKVELIEGETSVGVWMYVSQDCNRLAIECGSLKSSLDIGDDSDKHHHLEVELREHLEYISTENVHGVLRKSSSNQGNTQCWHQVVFSPEHITEGVKQGVKMVVKHLIARENLASHKKMEDDKLKDKQERLMNELKKELIDNMEACQVVN